MTNKLKLIYGVFVIFACMSFFSHDCSRAPLLTEEPCSIVVQFRSGDLQYTNELSDCKPPDTSSSWSKFFMLLLSQIYIPSVLYESLDYVVQSLTTCAFSCAYIFDRCYSCINISQKFAGFHKIGFIVIGCSILEYNKVSLRAHKRKKNTVPRVRNSTGITSSSTVSVVVRQVPFKNLV